MKILKIAGVSVLALGLVLGIALPSLATSDAAKPWAEDFQSRVVKGKVISVDEENQKFVIKSGEEEVTIKVDENTKYFKIGVPGQIMSLAQHWMGRGHQNEEMPQLGDEDMPKLKPKLKWHKPSGEEAGFSDIAVGDMVVVWLAEDGNLAERMQIIKPATYTHVSGTIRDISTGDQTITIAPDDGEAVTLYYNEGTIFTLKGIIQVQTGQSANAIYGDNMIAKVVTVH
jgi:hypothetical protein